MLPTFRRIPQNGNGGAIANSSGNMLSLTFSAVAGNTGVTGPDILGAVTTDGGSNVWWLLALRQPW